MSDRSKYDGPAGVDSPWPFLVMAVVSLASAGIFLVLAIRATCAG